MKPTRHQLVRRCCRMLFAFALILPNPLIALEWVEKDGHRLAKLTVEPSERDGFKLLERRVTRVEFANRLTRQLVAKGLGRAHDSRTGELSPKSLHGANCRSAE